MNRFDSTTASPNYIEATKEIPRSQTIHSDVLVPLFYSGALGLGVSGLALLLEATERPAAAMGLGVALVAFVVQGLWNRDLLMTTETVLRHDFDGDGHIGKPEPQRHITEIAARISKDDGRGTQDLFIEWDLHPDVVCDLFRAALDDDRLRAKRGGILPASQWTGSGRPLSRGSWTAFMARLREHDLAQYRAGVKENGHELTTKGRHLLDQWLEKYVDST